MKIEGTDIEITEAVLYRPIPGDFLMFTVDTQSQEVLDRIRSFLQETFGDDIKVMVITPTVDLVGVVREEPCEL